MIFSVVMIKEVFAVESFECARHFLGLDKASGLVIDAEDFLDECREDVDFVGDDDDGDSLSVQSFEQVIECVL